MQERGLLCAILSFLLPLLRVERLERNWRLGRVIGGVVLGGGVPGADGYQGGIDGMEECKVGIAGHRR